MTILTIVVILELLQILDMNCEINNLKRHLKADEELIARMVADDIEDRWDKK